MYLKVTKAKEHEYLKIVESYRDKSDGKIKHRVLFNLGRLDKLVKHTALIDKLVQKLGGGRYVKIDDINKGSDASVYNYGYIVLRRIWKIYKLDTLFSSLLKTEAISNTDRAIADIFSLVINRALLSEASKYGYYKNRDRFLFLNESLKLHDLYRSLELMEKFKEDIEKHLFSINADLFNSDLSVAFYDVTTLYFESKREDTDTKEQKGLRKFGLSKDYKINETQIVLSLLIDKNGIPVTFEIYEGNRAETSTLLDTLDRLKSRFGISKVTIVADRGIAKWLNLSEIKARGYEYITAVSFRQDRELMKMVTDKEGYRQISFDEDRGYYGYKAFEYTKRKRLKVYPGYSMYDDPNQKEYIYKEITLSHTIISTYSDKRAKKDESDRNRALQKLQKSIERGSALKKSKYLKLSSGSCSKELEIDLQKIEEDSKFDGFYALASSDSSLQPMEVIKIHKTIYDIENAFRDIKHSLSIRPIYHYKKERIKGHIIVSFLAYFLLKQIEYRMKCSKKVQERMEKEEETLSIKKIVNALNSMNVTKTSIQDRMFYLRHAHDKTASRIIDLLKIKLPSNIMDEPSMRLYIS